MRVQQSAEHAQPSYRQETQNLAENAVGTVWRSDPRRGRN
jgi:hypothetical protein